MIYWLWLWPAVAVGAVLGMAMAMLFKGADTTYEVSAPIAGSFERSDFDKKREI